ncbi:OLC1v1015062C1 [Oldenlandia corymbosa var. corymbosa]|uniref:OLC1v1015062C1 n=1 Tax=Oldenlandia corymbosa var. corymbosa TaxID=529605 RepID=A0AAV1E2E0_OLDCO|nr:OLC1v1015062C1 [Oldenlandia corymbosa var. corymbosa]
MEIEGSDGSKANLKWDSIIEWGRGSGFKTDDRTVSRRHVELQPVFGSGIREPRVRFIVHGKNPIWVHRSKTGEVSGFKTSESGELEIGDAFCVSAKNPVWFTCKDVEIEAENGENNGKGELRLDGELADSLSGGFEVKGFDALELESVDISLIDPVKEFGFLVIGEEFNSYPRRMIKDIKNWDWFLEEGGDEGSEDDNEVGGNNKRRTRKRKKKGGRGEDDEEWTGESEEEEEQMELLLKSKEGKVQKTPKYSTRSKDRQKLKLASRDDAGENKKVAAPLTRRKADKNADVNMEDEEEDDEGDETLGGFIVGDEDLEEVEDEEEEEEEEEEEDFDGDELDD